MSLQIWLPLNGDLKNLGLRGDLTITAINTLTFNTDGKIGKSYQRATNSTQVTTGVEINNNLVDLLGSQASVAVWVKPLGTHTHYNGTILSSGNWNAQRWAFGVNQDNTKVDVLCGSYNNYINCTVPANEWTHLCSTYDNGVAKVYKNGVYIGQLTGQAAFNSDAANACVGRETYASGYFGFNGLINDVRIYDHVLSIKEIKEIYKTLVLHYKLDNGGMGTPNLIPRSIYSVDPWLSSIKAQETYDGKFAYRLAHNTLYSKTSNGTLDIFNNTITYKADTQYTLSIDWRDDYRTDNKNSSWYLRFYYTDGSTATQIISPSNTINKWTHSVMTSAAGKTISAIRTTYGNGGQLYFANLKLEEGTQETGYSISQEDINTFYDSSGYSNNAVPVGTITTANTSPRYNNSVNFNGSSAIKVSDNNWVSQKMREMTINLWVRPTASFSKLFSCTESGGWNTESGNSGYLRFPIYVYTDAAQTSRAYKYDSNELQVSAVPLNEWTMLTFIYDGNGTRTYINGELHHTYTNTSYGISYNTGARLFLGCEANAANATGPYFTGQMSDFRLYATALAADDIKELYHTPYSADRNGNIYAREVVEI